VKFNDDFDLSNVDLAALDAVVLKSDKDLVLLLLVASYIIDIECAFNTASSLLPGMYRHQQFETDFLIDSTAQGIERRARDFLQMGPDANAM
jgi:hypothetical protein